GRHRACDLRGHADGSGQRPAWGARIAPRPEGTRGPAWPCVRRPFCHLLGLLPRSGLADRPRLLPDGSRLDAPGLGAAADAASGCLALLARGWRAHPGLRELAACRPGRDNGCPGFGLLVYRHDDPAGGLCAHPRNDRAGLHLPRFYPCFPREDSARETLGILLLVGGILLVLNR